MSPRRWDWDRTGKGDSQLCPPRLRPTPPTLPPPSSPLRRYADWEAKRAEAKEDGTQLPCATEHLWKWVRQLPAVRDGISEFVKLAELVEVQPIGSVSNERKFSDVNNLKTATRNRLQTPHLNVCMRIYNSTYTHTNFPIEQAFARFKPAA